jgi:hypothetical protein
VKNGVFIKKQYYDHIFAKTISSLSKKTPIFLPNFSAKIFLKSSQGDQIGFSPITRLFTLSSFLENCVSSQK